MQLKGKILNLDCANCALKIERAIKKIDGVKDAKINFLSQRYTVELENDVNDDIVFCEVKKAARKIEPDCEFK